MSEGIEELVRRTTKHIKYLKHWRPQCTIVYPNFSQKFKYGYGGSPCFKLHFSWLTVTGTLNPHTIHTQNCNRICIPSQVGENGWEERELGELASASRHTPSPSWDPWIPGEARLRLWWCGGLESDSAQRYQTLEHWPVLFYTAGPSALSCVTFAFPYLVRGIEQNPLFHFIKDE